MLHLKRYFASLAVVLTLLGAYALAVAPWLEPPPLARKAADTRPGSLAPSPATQVDFLRLFSPGSWELDNPKIVETDACTLLVKDYQPTDDGQLKLTPCTLIFYVAGQANGPRRPIVLQAPQGAVIQFDEVIDMSRAQFGKLVGGRLPGEITIFSPPTAPGADDALHLTTRNVQIDKQRVFTPHEVAFNYGASHGRGRDLTIALLPKDPEDPSSGVGGVRSLTLAKIEHLHLETKGQGLLPSLPNSADKAEAAAPLEVSCQGPFVFDVMTSTALFDDGVEVLRINSTGPPDKLLCRQLMLVFAKETSGPDGPIIDDDAKVPTGALSEQAAADPLAGKLQRLVAVGSPVTLEAPSQAARISAGRIEYFVPKRRLVLTSVDPASSVTLTQEDSEFVARELEYELTEPGRLGRMWAAGPGRLQFAQGLGPTQQIISASWDKDLRIQPDGQTQVISVVENATITAVPLGRFAARELHLWVREVEQKSSSMLPKVQEPEQPLSAAKHQESGDGRQGAGDKRQPRYTIQPARLLAVGSVRLDSPKLNVNTSRLEAWFHNAPARPQPLPPILQIASAAHRPAASIEPDREDEKPRSPPGLQHFDLAGDMIQMQVVRQGSDLNLENLTIRGHIVLDESHTPESGQPPIRIVGDRLELRGGVTGPGKIDVVGQPAEVGGRGLKLVGSEIHLLRDENRLWIDGPGEAYLPATSVSQQAGVRSSESARVPASGLKVPLSRGLGKLAGDIHIVWQEGLAFDGQTADIAGDVQARTTTQVATCQTLQASLATPINFAAAKGEPAELGRLKLDGGVFVVSRGLDERGEQQSYEQLQVRDLTIDRTAGSLYASGPGWMSSTRIATATLPGIGDSPPPVIPLPVDPAAPPKLNYIHVSFEGEIVGELAKQEIQIQRLVRTTFAPVGDWDERVEVSRLEDLGEKGVLMTSERLTVTEMAPAGQPAWIEASASGNTVVEGKSFTVHAPRITYTSDKEVLSLEGDGRADAELWYRTVPGQPSSYGAASKWRYWLRTGLFDVEGARPFEFQLNGIDKIRLPGRR